MPTSAAATADPDTTHLAPTDGDTLHRGLKNRHIQMIALGGAIGTGLFYGSASSVHRAGPAILISYAIGGLIIFLVMRALGEMSVEEPVTGAFAHYARTHWGELPGYYSGWNYWFSYVAVSMAELTVVGVYINHWWPTVPAWVSAAVCLAVITAVNLIEVSAYGEFEFWFALIKVVAIVAMIIGGLIIITTGVGTNEPPVGLTNLTAHGGFMPQGLWGVASALAVVMFAFGGVELIGIAAGEADNPRTTIPRAINQVIHRIFLFYVGAVFVMLCLFPWNQIGQNGSPFVTIFDQIGVPYAGDILNVVVLSAAVSAYNSGLYSNGRMLHTLAHQGNAPRFLGQLSRTGAPAAGVLVSSAVTASAVLLVALFPKDVFGYVMAVALFAAGTNWAMITYTHLRFRRGLTEAQLARLHFPMPGAPYSNYLVLGFFVVLLGVMWTQENFRPALIVGPLWAALLIASYYIRRHLLSRRGESA
ncbi:Aromatic amino acid transport protein AroP [Austwickia sp. TVS 96-490-7B]|uniref:amino acid permease n=1 Tax=Austwickia sp. TVS 96-490-7B TaxID=2830843 RepID=UPI001DE111F0|nr:amino acid permease [Austwickia sp. TVS 96-490-7B]MBW3085504.1 Aromatic amino acid transport protein AroP [Austwickia sp. TVS 96-490-7B]